MKNNEQKKQRVSFLQKKANKILQPLIIKQMYIAYCYSQRKCSVENFAKEYLSYLKDIDESSDSYINFYNTVVGDL